MFSDNNVATNKILDTFSAEDKKILQRVISDVGFFKVRYIILKSNIYMQTAFSYGIIAPNIKVDLKQAIFSLMDSIHKSTMLDLVNFFETGIDNDDRTILKTLDYIEMHLGLVTRFLNAKYGSKYSKLEVEKSLKGIKKEYSNVLARNSKVIKTFRNKTVAHFTYHEPGSTEIMNVVKENMVLYLALVKSFEEALIVPNQYLLFARVISEKINSQIIACCNALLKTLPVYKFIKRQMTQNVMDRIGFPQKQSLTIVFNGGSVLHSK